MYQTDLHYQQQPKHQQQHHQQQQQHIYAQQPSSTTQTEFFSPHSNTSSFPSTPDFNASSFGIAAGSPHWPASPPVSTNGADGQIAGSELHNWSPSPASFDHQQPQAAAGSYSHPSQLTASYSEQQQQGEPQFFRRTTYADPNGYSSPSHQVTNFQGQQQPQQFYDPNTRTHSVNPTFFNEMRLSSSHSTSSTASSALSEHQWAGSVYEESPFVHQPPDDNYAGNGSVVGTPASFTNEPLPLTGLEPLSLHDYDPYEQQQQQQQSYQQHSQSQPQQFFHQQQSPYSSGDFGASSEHINGVNGSPLVPASQHAENGYSVNGVVQHPHPYGSMGPSDSSTSLHSIHSQHSLHSQASHHSLNQYAQQQQQPPQQQRQQSQSQFPGQQSSFPGLGNLASVLPNSPNPPIPGLSSSTGSIGNSVTSVGVTGMLGGTPGHIAVMHTDDANSKETQFLRRRCFNCRTTDPPSWRRSTLNTGKIVCNKCGLYERTHMRPRPPRFDEMRTGASSNGSSSSSPAASAGIPNKMRKNPSKPGLNVLGSPAGSNSSVMGASSKGGISKIRKDRDRSVSRTDSSRRGSFSSSASATSDWDDSLANFGGSSSSGPGNNGIPIPSYNYGPAGSHIYGHSLPYPQLPAHSQSLDSGTATSVNGGGGIRIPRAPAMGMNRSSAAGNGAAPGASSTTSSRPASSAGGSAPGSEEGSSPFAAGISDSTSPNLHGTTTLLPPPRKSATWSSGVGVNTVLVSPSSSTPPPPISGTLGFTNGERSRKASLASLNTNTDGQAS